MSLTVVRWMIAVSVGAAVGFGLATLLDAGLSLLLKVWRLRWPHRWRAFSVDARSDQDRFSEEVLNGTAGVNWPLLTLLAGCLGLLVTWLLFAGRGSPLSLAGALAGLAPLAVRRYRMQRAKRRLRREIRTFITDLRLGLKLEGTPGPALVRVSQSGGGLLRERLRHHVHTRLTATSPQEVLRGLAQDLRSRELKDLLVPMLVTLFTPVLVLVLYPLMDRVIRSLAGAAPIY